MVDLRDGSMDHGFPAPFWPKLGDKLPGGFL